MASAFKRKDTGRWMACWKDDAGRKHQKTCTGLKADALRLARRLEREAQVVGGVRRSEDKFEVHADTPIGRHIDDYLSSLRNKRRQDSHVDQLKAIFIKVFAAAGIATIRELDSVLVSDAIAGLAKSPSGFSKRKAVPGQLSDRTKSNYGVRLRSFGKWLVKVGRTAHNSLAGVDTVGGSAIRGVHGRRALSEAEVVLLLDAAARRPIEEISTIRRGTRVGQLGAKVSAENLARARRSGLERSTIYMMAVRTGLRRGEIQALQWADCHCDAKQPYIQLRAVATKSRRADRVPLHPELVAQLKVWMEECTQAKDGGTLQQAESVFQHVPSMATFKSDLAFAGIAYEVAGKGFIDFHALRKTCSTLMAAANVPARIRQAVMRHSSPELTETTYMDEDQLPLYEHIAGMKGLVA